MDHIEAPDGPKFHLHHIIPFSRAKEGYNTDIDVNIKRITKKLHQRWHKLFNNKLPHEQLEIWLDVNGKVLAPHIRKAIGDLIYIPPNQFYRAEVTNEQRAYRKKHKKKRGRPRKLVLNPD